MWTSELPCFLVHTHLKDCTYHIGIREVKSDKGIQVTGGQPVGRQGSDLGRETSLPLPQGCLLTCGCGQINALHNKQEHVVVAQVRKDPFSRQGDRGRYLSPTGSSHLLQRSRGPPRFHNQAVELRTPLRDTTGLPVECSRFLGSYFYLALYVLCVYKHTSLSSLTYLPGP